MATTMKEKLPAIMFTKTHKLNPFMEESCYLVQKCQLFSNFEQQFFKKEEKQKMFQKVLRSNT